ncbi:MAG: polyprenyl diphosphate synthase [Syntrophorhabdaceae bacterium]|nr:polyprenyl diphosphate synthase [Syntrophorhabdaceae bacterium]
MPIKRVLYYFYERLLLNEVKKKDIPTHIGLILDGNRRYAIEKGFNNVTMGHKVGAQKLDEVLNWCSELGVKIVTIWVLSTENIHREKKELEALLKVIEEKIGELTQSSVIKKNGFRIKAIGNIDILPQSLKETIKKAEEATESHKNHVLNIAVGYGGREEIVEAVKKAIMSKKTESISVLAESITTEDIASHLYTNGIPDPDLIIRTSGEIRLSGFLLWQSAYSEFYFCDALWPAFRKIDFLRAIRSYQHRVRRFGR